MSSGFANRRKPRKIGVEDDDNDTGPVVKRPTSSKLKQKSKTRLSFGAGETSMTDGGSGESEVVVPKKHGLGRRVLEKNASQQSITPSGSNNQLPLRVGPEQDRPSYNEDYLKELRNLTHSTPKPTTDDEISNEVDVAAKFGEIMKVTAPSAIPTEAEIREKKSRRARLAKEKESHSLTEQDYISLEENANDDWELVDKEDLRDTRLVRDDEDFAEGFDEYVEDGRISLGKKAEREHKKKQREAMRELIEEAEALSDEEDSDLEEKAAYEASQARAAMGYGGKDPVGRPKTPPKMTSLPRLSTCLDRLRTSLAVLEKSRSQMINQMEELRKEKADISVREVEIQALIKETGDNYEKLKQEAGVTPGSEITLIWSISFCKSMSNEPMSRAPFFSLGRWSLSWPGRPGEHVQPRRGLALIETPIDETDGVPPHLYRHSDATPIELFFDLFFVANLSTFTATHEINNVEALGAYIGFLGVIWFSWLQVTMFDIRFARDSLFERICKAIQLGAMVGFASAGTRFTTHIREENVWAFQSLSLILGGSRFLLAIQYTVSIMLIRKRMSSAAKGLCVIAGTLFVTSLIYMGMFFAFGEENSARSYIWTVWFVLFWVEMWTVITTSCFTPGIGFQDTHLNVRMGLLTLIIIGEGVISVTRIVNKTVRPGGWTKWSFVHILGVTTNVYFIWQEYFDLTPRRPMGTVGQQIWAQLHFPFHVVLVLLLEGSQILALTLDITLKLQYLVETILFACEEPQPHPELAIRLLRQTIEDMEIEYNRGAINEQKAIYEILDDLPNYHLCPLNGTIGFRLTRDLFNDLVGNVTSALFASMRIVPPRSADVSRMDSSQLLRMYVKLLGFVYVYFFIVASLAMFLFAAFGFIARRHDKPFAMRIGVAVRIILGVVLVSLTTFAKNFELAYAFMKSPTILYAFTFVLLTGKSPISTCFPRYPSHRDVVLLVDRLLDRYAGHQGGKNPSRRRKRGKRDVS
ncbi:nineteen complex-related protein 2-domain-containing protein [Aspergillus cavernicola]|uniref:Nineteen complex-related protein 2-domain-containing protein n=1 Tax=Aspergillus cavernicola TaxID=176166 RepID=A0ABR4IVM2_9EURO